jgi:hypothetical protein
MDLTRFDRQIAFTPVEIACLMCGIDPAEPYPKDAIKNDLNLIETGFMNGFKFCKGDTSFVSPEGRIQRCLFSVDVEKIFASESVELPRKKSAFEGLTRNVDNAHEEFDGDDASSFADPVDEYLVYFSHGEIDKAKFLETLFSRVEVAMWLSSSGLDSKYAFLTANEVAYVAANKPLGTKERNTLLTIIAVLCKEAKIDYTKPAKAAGLIQSTAAFMAISIGETTIEDHLKKIPDALATRMK